MIQKQGRHISAGHPDPRVNTHRGGQGPGAKFAALEIGLNGAVLDDGDFAVAPAPHLLAHRDVYETGGDGRGRDHLAHVGQLERMATPRIRERSDKYRT